LADDTITAVPENSKVFLITSGITDDGRVMIKAEKTQLNIVVIGYKSQFMEVYNHLNVITQTVIVQERLEHFKLKLLTSGNLLEKIKIDHNWFSITISLTDIFTIFTASSTTYFDRACTFTVLSLWTLHEPTI
jgi:hypothetical protein